MAMASVLLEMDLVQLHLASQSSVGVVVAAATSALPPSVAEVVAAAVVISVPAPSVVATSGQPAASVEAQRMV